jgi:hypothetical protein
MSLPVTGDIVAKSGWFGWYFESFFGVSAAPGGDLDVLELTGGHNGAPLFLSPMPQTLSTFAPSTIFAMARDAPATAGDSTPFYALEEAPSRIRAYGRDGFDNATPFTQRAELVLDKPPCGITQPLSDPRPIIGQRNGGFSLLNIGGADMDGNFDLGISQRYDTNESFCALTEIRNAIAGGGQMFNGNNARVLYDLLAFDVDTNTVSVFEEYKPAPSDPEMYRLRERVPVDLNTSKSLRFVKGMQISPYGSPPAGLVLLFTDDQHVGTHRLVVVGLDVDRTLVQQTISWAVGAPTDVADFYSKPSPGLPMVFAVISETSPEAMVFTPRFVTHAESNVIPYSGPEYFEIGLGASLGEAQMRADSPDDIITLLIMDSEDHEARIYGPLPF